MTMLDSQFMAARETTIAALHRWRRRHHIAGKWLLPVAAAGLTLAISCGLGWLIPVHAEKIQLELLKVEEGALKQAYVQRTQRAPQVELALALKLRAQQHLDLLEQQLTHAGELEAVMNEIDAAGLARGLRFTLVRPESGPASASRELSAIQLQAVGTYQAIARFADDIARLPRIVILDPLTIQALARQDGNASAQLTMQATASAILHTRRSRLTASADDLRAADRMPYPNSDPGIADENDD